ncbi:MAG: YpdA family putative bacillithiol disulfide reductase, partial [Bacteroidota bacterium]
MHDIIIVGGGPIGINCAIVAKENGLSALIIEKGTIVNSLFHFPTNMTFFSTSKLLEIGEVPFISHSDKPTRRESLEYYRRVVTSWDLDVRTFETVENIESKGGQFDVYTSKGQYTSKFVIIATGFFDKVRKLNVPGEELPKVKHYYDEPHPYVGQKIIVVGGANSACDVALETYHKGAEVTMVVRKERLYEKVKYWILPNIQNRIKEGSIKAYFNSNISEIRNNEVDINTPEGKITLQNDFVLAMT